MGRQKYSKDFLEKIEELYQTKNSKKISEILGLPYTTVRSIISAYKFRKPKQESVLNKKYGRLTVISERFYKWIVTAKGGRNEAWVKCRCDCNVEGEWVLAQLKSGNTQSCGCLAKELLSKRMSENITHGESNSNLYRRWAGMKNRCTNPKEKSYKRYGERNIKVCNEWLNDFAAFRDWALANGYEEHLTIDRKDNNGDYCPNNCRWATEEVQQNNKSSNRIISAFGEEKTVAEWSKDSRCVVNYDILSDRINKCGMTNFEEAITKPNRRSKN